MLVTLRENRMKNKIQLLKTTANQLRYNKQTDRKQSPDNGNFQ